MCNPEASKKPLPEGIVDAFLGNMPNRIILEPCRELSFDEMKLIKDCGRNGDYIELNTNL